MSPIPAHALLLGAYTPPASGPPVSGYVAWWDASDTATITAASNLVSKWADKAAVGPYDLVQATGSSKPSSGLHAVNGLNVITYDGGNAQQSLAVTSALPSNQPFTVFCVAKATTTSGTNLTLATGNGLQLLRSNSNAIEGAYAGNAFATSGTWGTTNAHEVAIKVNGASSAIYVDGGSAATNSSGASNPSSPFIVGNLSGGFFPWKGYLCEIVLYASALSDGDRASVSSSLKAKWGTP